MPAMKRIEVVAAILRDDRGRILATQRGYGDWKDYWEFPGGKLEPGETPEAALHREIREELAACIDIEQPLPVVEYDYPTFHITLHCYLCRLTGDITLIEHEAARWLASDELNSVSWLPADEQIIEWLRTQPIQ